MDLAQPSAGQCPATSRELTNTLSLVVQGPLFAANLTQVTEYCAQWRANFPACPIILAVSQSDLPVFARPGLIERPGTGAADLIWNYCNEVVLAEPAPVLPGVKRGLPRNYVNLQIATAKAGLERVATDHVLRVRNDLLLSDGGLIDYYLERCRQPRGREALLDQRVLISPWFTLNPYGVERLAFHFSDWFHLGLTRDVRRLWDVPFMVAADATFYRRHRHRHRADSGPRERAFRSRLAVEQHLTTGALHKLGRAVRLDTHDDARDSAASLEIFADNFAVADFGITPIRFDRYRHLADAREIDLLCLGDHDWWALVEAAAPRDIPALLADKIPRADRFRAGEAAAERRRSPLRRLLQAASACIA